jgi:hypothetical protein
MSRQSPFGHPCLVGFDEIEQALDRVARSGGEGYPPYNIERIPRTDAEPERLRIMLAVAGFTPDQLEVTVEECQLIVRGRQVDDKSRDSSSGPSFSPTGWRFSEPTCPTGFSPSTLRGPTWRAWRVASRSRRALNFHAA